MACLSRRVVRSCSTVRRIHPTIRATDEVMEENVTQECRLKKEVKSSSPNIYLEEAFVACGGKPLSSTKENWQHFWKRKPQVVAIDCEGIHFKPPLLIQVAYGDNEVILDVPQQNNRLSPQLQRVINDSSITKIFFGNPNRENLGSSSMTNCVDLQRLLVETYDLDRSRLPSLATAATFVLRDGPYIKNQKRRLSFSSLRFQTRPSSSAWLNHKLQLYSAADAWFALRIYQALLSQKRQSEFASSEIAANGRSSILGRS